MIAPVFIVPSAEFTRVLERYAAGSKKAFGMSIVSRVKDIIYRTWQHTTAAKRETIERTFNVIGYTVKRSRKTGQLKRGRAILGTTDSGMTNAGALWIAQQIRDGKRGDLRGMSRADIEKEGRKLLSNALRSIGFIRSGWIPALQKLSSIVRGGAFPPGARREAHGRDKGYANVFVNSEHPEVTAGNTTKAASLIGTPAVHQAMAEAQSYMLSRIEKDLLPERDKLRGKVIR